MMKHEFENLTMLTVSVDEYVNNIEPKYMNSKLDKQQWCRQYVKSLRTKQLKNAIYKSSLKTCLKYDIENWVDGELDEDSIYYIKYTDGSFIMFNYEYEGKKPSLQNITNIYYSGSCSCMDFYHDWIGNEECWDFHNEMHSIYPNNSMWDLPVNPLVVEDTDDYYKKFEA